MDDVTIFRLHSDDLVVGLWQDDVITEMWYIGEYVKAMLETTHFTEFQWNFCERSASLCCRSIPNPYPGLNEPTHIPQPNVTACTAVIQNCPDQSNQACGCLNTACEFCFNHADYCHDEAFPWLPDAHEAACVAGTQHCVNQPDGDGGPGAVVIDLLQN